MTTNAVEVRDEFDRLADFGGGWDANSLHHTRLLRSLPAHIGILLDAGCGAGAFVRAIAPRCDRVIALDLSPKMIARAKATGVPPNVELVVGDVLESNLPEGQIDAIVSIAALHHMALEPALSRFAKLLRPGGTLAVLDLYQPSGLTDRALWMISAALAPPIRWLRTRQLIPAREVRDAWALHEVHDRYETIPNLVAAAHDALPGSTIRRRLFWRYTLIWTKPEPR